MNTMRIGDRATFTNGANGAIVAVYNGGACYQFRADNGVRFTVRADEVAPEGRTPSAPHVDTGTTCRTVVLFDRPSPQYVPQPRVKRTRKSDDVEPAEVDA